MWQLRFSLVVFLALLGIAMPAAADPIVYPPTARGPVVETLFGEAIADPYRWLENDVRTDPAVAAWVTAENQVTDAYLATLPGRARIAARLRALWDYERTGPVVKRGQRYFHTRNGGLQNQSPLYVRDALDGASRLLIDPNGWSRDGATALAEWEPSDDGRRLAYAVQDGGSDWRTVRILDVDTGEPLADELRWVKFSELAWSRDGSLLFYSRFPAPADGQAFQATNERQQVFAHRIGTPQSADRLVYATPDRPKLSHSAEVTDDGAWLVITSSEGTDDRYEITLIDLRRPGAAPVPLVRGLEHGWQLAGGIGDRLWFVTNKGAPRQRIVSVDAARPSEPPRELVAESRDKLESASLVGDVILATYLADVKTVVRRFARDGAPLGELTLPGIGTAGIFPGRAGDPETFYAFTSFNIPTAIYRYDAAADKSMPFAVPKVVFDPADYVVGQRFYRSKDGARVPLFVVHRRGLDLARGAPTMLYGYGGFNIAVLPAFSPATLAWMEMGGVYAVANIRGGGEYGKAWHDGGRLAAKQNAFDDFIAAAEYLKAERIAAPDGLVIHGGSNGGLLVGAVVNQRPDLFAAALPAVGVMDMLRFDRFTAGRYWIDDYGYPSREADFRVLRAYSPLHNLRAGATYPAILVTTADTDDRVVPGHSFKYAAAIQAADLGPRPRLIRIETRAGHGSGKPTDKAIAEYADMWAFAARWTGLKPPSLAAARSPRPAPR